MSEPDHCAVRFSCPRCFARLKASLVQVGTKRRCPRCHKVFEVPTAAEAARRRRNVGEYRVSEGTEWSPGEGPAQILVTCPVCATLMYATEQQVGRELTCPDCDTAVVVPPPVVEEKRPPPAVPVEQYALSEEAEALPPGRRAADQSYVPVTCPVCQTFMQLTADHVGEEIICPDCGEPLMVPSPAERKEKKAAPRVELGEYALHEEDEATPRGAPAAEEARFSFRCPLCDTLIYARADQVGQETMCEDCETWFAVPRPPPPGRKPDLRSQAGDVYGVGKAIEVPEQEPSVSGPSWRLRPGAETAADRRRETDRVRPRKPPRWSFFSGVFFFPLQANSWARWLGLSLGAILPLYLTAVAVALARDGVLLLSVLLFGPAFFFGGLWLAVAAASYLRILQDTSDGYHDVESWPEPVFVDWMGDFFFLATSLALSALPGVLLKRVLEPSGVEAWLSLPVSLVVLFPINLLAMLERNSALDPFSAPVWRSLFTAWWGWGLFYIESTLLIGGAGWLTLLAASNVPLMGIGLAAPLWVAVLMIYFRLLGRLAWHCREKAARQERLAESLADDDEVEAPQ